MRRKALLAVLFGLLIAAGVLAAAVVAEGPAAILTNTANPPPDDHKVQICHAVAADDGGNQHNGYDLITVDKDSIAGPNGHDGHNNIGGSSRSDIIPAFAAGSHANQTWNAYPGKGDASLISSGCGAPPETTSSTTTTTPTTTTSPTTTGEERGVATAGAVCVISENRYRVFGSIDGNPATVDPQFIAGNRTLPTIVTVTLGADSQQVIVNTAGDCVQTQTTTTVPVTTSTPSSTSTPTTTVATTSSTPATTSSTPTTTAAPPTTTSAPPPDAAPTPPKKKEAVKSKVKHPAKASTPNELPFTGLREELGLLAGLLMLGTGLVLRRSSR